MGDTQPLAPQTYHILLALGDETLHGYGIIQAFEELTDGAETLLPGSLYAALGRMVQEGVIAEAGPPRNESSSGPARRYYRMTARGRAAARSESARRARLLELAQARGLAPAKQGL